MKRRRALDDPDNPPVAYWEEEDPSAADEPSPAVTPPALPEDAPAGESEDNSAGIVIFLFLVVIPLLIMGIRKVIELLPH